jgi:hypothetical protein
VDARLIQIHSFFHTFAQKNDFEVGCGHLSLYHNVQAINSKIMFDDVIALPPLAGL